MDLGNHAYDPRLTRNVTHGASFGDTGMLVELRDGTVHVDKAGDVSVHPDVPTALRYLLGEPRSRLAWALADAFDGDELYEIHLYVAQGSSTPARDRLIAAIDEAREG